MRLWLKARNTPDGFDNFISFMIGAIDAILTAQNAILAAESEGLMGYLYFSPSND